MCFGTRRVAEQLFKDEATGVPTPARKDHSQTVRTSEVAAGLGFEAYLPRSARTARGQRPDGRKD